MPSVLPVLERAIALGRMALQFARVERITKHEDGIRWETDSDHTVMLGIVACELAPITLDVGLVARFALVHDLVEVYAGDTPTLQISSVERASKEEREMAARERLVAELGAQSWICQTIGRYEAQVEPEARYVRLLDKVMPKLTHALNRCVAAKVVVDYDGFIAAHARQYGELATKYPEFPEILALLRASMDHAEACWCCDVCGESIQMHVDGRIPGEVFMDGFGEVACTEVAAWAVKP
jgi:5'-deoxynucleotidase YfbR-like HD superfamily hydrolase